MKLNDECIRASYRPRRKWNPLKCVPLVLILWCALCYYAGVVWGRG